MVSVTAAEQSAHEQLVSGLTAEEAARVREALDFVQPVYAGQNVVKGQDAYEYALTVAGILAQLQTDVDTRIAALLFELPVIAATQAEKIEDRFGKEIANLVAGIRQLMRLHEVNFEQQEVGKGKNAQQQAAMQLETLRKMLLAMATDMRVVLVRLASRVASLRYFAEQKLDNERTREYGRTTLDLYAPLANRLGVWQLKWELEDLSFRFIEPETYKRIARMLEEKRLGREVFRRRCHRAPEGGNDCSRHRSGSLWPPQAYLQHLEQDEGQVARLFRTVRCARLSCHRRRRQDLLRCAGHRAPHLDTHP